MKFVRSFIIPGATGEVAVKKDKNNNYLLNVRIVNLAEAQRLSSPKDACIVWMDSDGATVQKLGRLKTSSGLLSRTVKAEMSTVPTVPTRVSIFAEVNPDVQSPDEQTLLDTRS